VDRSGSSLEGFRFAQSYIPRVLASLGEDAEFGVVLVDSGVRLHPEGKVPAKARSEEKAAALEFVLGAEGGAGSCPAKGFKAAIDFAKASRAERKVILYIGDGGGTCGGMPEPEYLELMCEDVTRRNRCGAEIHAIGVGAGLWGEAVLLYLTERNGGTYTRLVTK
jgi:hypothetical protein